MSVSAPVPSSSAWPTAASSIAPAHPTVPVDIASLYAAPPSQQPALPASLLTHSLPHAVLSRPSFETPSWLAGVPHTSSPIATDNSPDPSTTATTPDVVSTAGMHTTSTLATTARAKDAMGFDLRLTSDAVKLAEQALDCVENLAQAVGSNAVPHSPQARPDGDTVLHQRVLNLSSRLHAKSQQLRQLKESGLGGAAQHTPLVSLSSSTKAAVERAGHHWHAESVSPRTKPPSQAGLASAVDAGSLGLSNGMWSNSNQASSNTQPWLGPAAGQLGQHSQHDAQSLIDRTSVPLALPTSSGDGSQHQLVQNIGLPNTNGTAALPAETTSSIDALPASHQAGAVGAVGAVPHLAGTIDMWPVIAHQGMSTVRAPIHDVGSWNAQSQLVNPQSGQVYVNAPGSNGEAVLDHPNSISGASQLKSSKRPMSSDGMLASKRARTSTTDIRSMSTSDATSMMVANPYVLHYPESPAYDPNNPATYPPNLVNEDGLMTYIPGSDKRYRNRRLLLDLRPHLYYYLGVHEFRQLTEEEPAGQWVRRLVPSVSSRNPQPGQNKWREVFNLDFQTRNFYKTNASLMAKMMELGSELVARHPETYGVMPGVLQKEHVEHVCKDLLDSARSGYRLALRIRANRAKGVASLSADSDEAKFDTMAFHTQANFDETFSLPSLGRP